MNKLSFLKNEFPKLVSKLTIDSEKEWGVLNAHQMIEHMTDSVSMATGKNNQQLHTPNEQVHAFKNFAMSEKEFKPNTKNSLMSETPAPTKTKSINDAIKEYESTLMDFENYFKEDKLSTLTNPFFGELNYEEWIHLLYKHAIHHCKQFKLI